jgi:UDP-sugar diphosphatase
MFYVEVDESMKVSDGGGIDTEDIELVYVPMSELDSYMFDDSVFAKDSVLQMGLFWFLRHKNRR